jgi:hypothetical protein
MRSIFSREACALEYIVVRACSLTITSRLGSIHKVLQSSVVLVVLPCHHQPTASHPWHMSLVWVDACRAHSKSLCFVSTLFTLQCPRSFFFKYFIESSNENNTIACWSLN